MSRKNGTFIYTTPRREYTGAECSEDGTRPPPIRPPRRRAPPVRRSVERFSRLPIASIWPRPSPVAPKAVPNALPGGSSSLQPGLEKRGHRRTPPPSQWALMPPKRSMWME